MERIELSSIFKRCIARYHDLDARKQIPQGMRVLNAPLSTLDGGMNSWFIETLLCDGQGGMRSERARRAFRDKRIWRSKCRRWNESVEGLAADRCKLFLLIKASETIWKIGFS